MDIEKPFSIIRKAIQATAEQAALDDLMDKPEKEHYNIAFNIFKLMKRLSPQMFEQLLMTSAKSKDLKDEMGIESYKIFNRIWKDLTKGFKNILNEAINQYRQEKQLSPEELKKITMEFSEIFFKEKGKELKVNPKIVSHFQGREDLLDRSIEHAIKATLDFIDGSEKYTPKWHNDN